MSKLMDKITVFVGLLGIFGCLALTVSMKSIQLQLLGAGLCFVGVAGLACTLGSMLRKSVRYHAEETKLKERKRVEKVA